MFKSKVFLALFAVAFILNADVAKNFAIICGTNGIGAKYSLYYERIGCDIGLPFYLEFDKNRRNDTLETKDIFSCNAYGTVNVIVYQRLLYDFGLGISVFAKTSYEYNKLSVDSTDLITSGLNLDFNWGPCFQYTRKNNNCNKLFSIAFWPVVITQDIKNRLKLATNVQLSYYL